jgi:hypothetical protein
MESGQEIYKCVHPSIHPSGNIKRRKGIGKMGTETRRAKIKIR